MSEGSREEGPSEALSSPWLPRLALLLVAIAFVPVLGFGFVRWDDPLHLLENPLVLDPGAHSLREHLLTPALGYPTPVTVLTYRLEYALVGLRVPALYHATNLALHVCACWLVGRLAMRIGLTARAAAFAMLLFGLHPVVAEPVAWISGRKDLLALVFALSSLLLALPSGRTRARMVSSLIFFVLGLASKPVVAWVALAMPFVATHDAAATVEAWRGRLGRGLPFALPHVALGTVAVIIAMLGQREVGAVHADRTVLELLRQAWYALGHHLGLVFFVREPCAKYMPAIWPPPFTPLVDLAPVVVAPVLGLLLRYLDPPRRKAAWLALLVLVASYLPSSNLVPLVRYLADSYVYGPMVGFGLFFGAVVDRFLERAVSAWVTWAGFATLAALLLMLVIPSELRFLDSVALWEDAYAKNPHDYRLCQNLAIAHYDTDGPAGVLEATDRCIGRFGPEHFEKNRGIALFRLGRLDEAAVELERARQRRPDDAVIRHYLEQIAAQRGR